MTSPNETLPNGKDELDTQSKSEDLLEGSPPTASATTPDNPTFGWSGYAERINGRFAMIGFIAILLVEAFSRETFLHWAGLIN